METSGAIRRRFLHAGASSFSDDDAVRVLQRCRELSHKFVLVSDLRRSWIATNRRPPSHCDCVSRAND